MTTTLIQSIAERQSTADNKRIEALGLNPGFSGFYEVSGLEFPQSLKTPIPQLAQGLIREYSSTRTFV